MNELAQLLRLRRLRLEAARAERDARRSALDAAEAAVREREAEIVRLRGLRDALAQRVVESLAAELGRLAPYASARREQLDDLLERAEYGLIDDEEERDAAQEAFDAARAAWQQALVRCDAVEALCRDARARQVREAEQRAERELEVPTMQGMR